MNPALFVIKLLSSAKSNIDSHHFTDAVRDARDQSVAHAECPMSIAHAAGPSFGEFL